MSKRDAIASVFGSHPAAGSTADAILSALTAAGYAVVPREPTEEMLQDGLRAAQKARHTGISGQTIGAVVRASAFREAAAYRAMLAAGEATDDGR